MPTYRVYEAVPAPGGGLQPNGTTAGYVEAPSGAEAAEREARALRGAPRSQGIVIVAEGKDDPTDTATLTLITCYPFDYIGPAPNRFVVRAERRLRVLGPAA